jgi:hypothetical protein
MAQRQRRVVDWRTAIHPASTTNTAALAAIGVAYVASLKPASAGADLLSRGLQLRFENRTQSISVPNLSLPDAAFVAEAAAIPVAQGPGAGVRLPPHKLGIIAVATAELLRNANAKDLIKYVLIVFKLKKRTSPEVRAGLRGGS